MLGHKPLWLCNFVAWNCTPKLRSWLPHFFPGLSYVNVGKHSYGKFTIYSDDDLLYRKKWWFSAMWKITRWYSCVFCVSCSYFPWVNLIHTEPNFGLTRNPGNLSDIWLWLNNWYQRTYKMCNILSYPYAPCIVYLPTFGPFNAIYGVNVGKCSSTMEQLVFIRMFHHPTMWCLLLLIRCGVNAGCLFTQRLLKIGGYHFSVAIYHYFGVVYPLIDQQGFFR